VLRFGVSVCVCVSVCGESDPKCYNPRVLKSLCHEKRHRSETAKQFFRSAHFNSRVTAQLVDTGQHSAAEQACNGRDHDNHQYQQE